MGRGDYLGETGVKIIRSLASVIVASLAGGALAFLLGVLVALWRGHDGGNLSVFVIQALMLTGAVVGGCTMLLLVLSRK